MAKTLPNPFPYPPKRTYWGAHIPMRVIRKHARAIVDEFQPNKIILFGSYAYGTPHENSDVDLLVIMEPRNHQNQAVRIRFRLAAPFPLDLLVRSPTNVASRLKDGESFMTSVFDSGRVLYEKKHEAVGEKGGRRLRSRTASQRKLPAAS